MRKAAWPQPVNVYSEAVSCLRRLVRPLQSDICHESSFSYYNTLAAGSVFNIGFNLWNWVLTNWKRFYQGAVYILQFLKPETEAGKIQNKGRRGAEGTEKVPL